jgi:hypothetical protein
MPICVIEKKGKSRGVQPSANFIGLNSFETGSLDEGFEIFWQQSDISRSSIIRRIPLRALNIIAAAIYCFRGHFKWALASEEEAYGLPVW